MLPFKLLVVTALILVGCEKKDDGQGPAQKKDLPQQEEPSQPPSPDDNIDIQPNPNDNDDNVESQPNPEDIPEIKPEVDPPPPIPESHGVNATQVELQILGLSSRDIVNLSLSELRQGIGDLPMDQFRSSSVPGIRWAMLYAFNGQKLLGEVLVLNWRPFNKNSLFVSSRVLTPDEARTIEQQLEAAVSQSIFAYVGDARIEFLNVAAVR